MEVQVLSSPPSRYLFKEVLPYSYMRYTAGETCGDFGKICEAQGVNLDHRLLERIEDYPKRPVSSLSSAAGRAFHESGSQIPLTDKCIDPFSCNDETAEYVRRMINTSRERAAHDIPGLHIARQNHERICVCPSVEPRFAATLYNLYTHGDCDGDARKAGGEIFVDSDGRAVGVRKALGVSLALLVCEVNWDGILLAPGAFGVLGNDGEWQGHGAVPEGEFAIRKLTEESFSLTRFSGFTAPLDYRRGTELIGDDEVANFYSEVTKLQPVLQEAIDGSNAYVTNVLF